MTTMSRRDICFAIPALAAVGVGATEARAMQANASEFPAPQGAPPQKPLPVDGKPGSDMPNDASASLAVARVFPLDQQPVRTMANGGESRDIVRGTLATGETVNLHQSMQVVGNAPNTPHVIQHSEFILVREGELEFQHEVDGKMVAEKVGPGGAIYVAFGTRHTVRNIGTVPARYFVVAIGGDAK
jgi:mannose-6-phosphate isomerase-like protein (cupin superfamily)